MSDHTAASDSDPESGTTYEGLVQFLYQAPIGLVQTTLDGEITMINPMSAQLLMPVAPDGNLINLFDVLGTVAPDLRAMTASFAPPSGVICESLRVRLQVGAAAQTLELSLLKMDRTTPMASLSDATLVVEQEQHRLASRLRDAQRSDGLTTLPNRSVALEDIKRGLLAANEAAEHQFAVLFINCDRFDRVNVNLGQGTGDDPLLSRCSTLKSAWYSPAADCPAA